MKMSQQQRQHTARKLSKQELYDYFYPRPISRWKFGAIAVGIILVLVGLFLPEIPIIGIGLCIGGGGAFFIYKQVTSRPDDESYDVWLRAHARQLYKRSLEMLAIQPGSQGETLTIQSFVLPGSMEAKEYPAGEVSMKLGKDGQWRFSINIYTFIFCTPGFLAISKSDINAFQPFAHLDTHSIYSYSKVFGAGITQCEDIVILNEQALPYQMENFCLELTNGKTKVMSAVVKARPGGNARGAPIIMLPGTNFDRNLSRLQQILSGYE